MARVFLLAVRGEPMKAARALLLAGSLLACAPPGPARYDLYVSDGYLVRAQRMVALEPLTLADRSDAPPTEKRPGWWRLSADGSTLVGHELRAGVRDLGGVTSPGDVTVVVEDARTGAERARFHPPVPATVTAVSRDGGRLVLERIDDRLLAAEWHLVAATGRTLGTTRVDGPEWGAAFVDPAARRLYRLLSPGLIHGRPPEPVRLVAYDLEAGTEVGRLEVADVRSGVRPAGAVDERVGVGVALSPDGRDLALVHADAEALTVVDLERLAVARTVAFARGRGPWEWLPLWPRPAGAKEVAGTERGATFAPDGRRLYVHGFAGAVEGARVAHRGLGLAVVDAATGRVLAEALAGEQVDYVRPAPDGRSLYAFGPRAPHGNILREDLPYRLRRLDAGTLAVLAERELVGYRGLLLWPRP